MPSCAQPLQLGILCELRHDTCLQLTVTQTLYATTSTRHAMHAALWRLGQAAAALVPGLVLFCHNNVAQLTAVMFPYHSSISPVWPRSSLPHCLACFIMQTEPTSFVAECELQAKCSQGKCAFVSDFAECSAAGTVVCPEMCVDPQPNCRKLSLVLGRVARPHRFMSCCR